MDTAVKPQGCTNLKLRQLMRRVAQHYDAEVGKTGLKGTQYSLLSYVLKLGPIRPGDLAREMKIGAVHADAQPAAVDRCRLARARSRAPTAAAGWSVSPTPAARSVTRRSAAGAWRRKASTRRSARAAWSQLHALIDECLELLSPLPYGEIDE